MSVVVDGRGEEMGDKSIAAWCGVLAVTSAWLGEPGVTPVLRRAAVEAADDSR